ncbi:hypothetical protein ACG9YX_19670 [Acinetobacter nematophilus]|uniref:hypothetical protein n=1 Tax=Acinetobacter nematophilus TaxID=2994642 RepID=UPI003AF9908E
MYKVLYISFALYIFLEILCHSFALLARKIVSRSDVQKLNHPLHLQFIQQSFYRIMLLLSIVLMSHFYSDIAFFEQNDWIRLTFSTLIILMILLAFWWLNAFILRQVILKQQAAVKAVFKQKISYIMLHPLQFKDLYITTDYLSTSVWINRLLSLVAFILLFVDIQVLFGV